MMIKTPLVEDIKAGFVHSPVDKIIGEPNYKSINHLHNQLIRNAAMLKLIFGGSNNGLAGLIKFPQMYFLQTGHHFIQPGNPGEAPTYPP
eukprot:1775388-Ditylum_brightwellii.AAC.1